MKNFKKVLALVLAIATLLSFATVASAKTADFADAKDVKNVEAVDVLSYIKVLEGYPADKSFKPAKNITREEAAKIIAIFANKSTDISSLYTSANPFADMKGRWGESYVAYGYRAGIIAGKNATSFVPKANVKGTEFLKMVLVVLGYDQNKEGLVGSSWAVNTLELAKAKKLLAGLGKDFDPNAALTRDEAAQIMLNALKAEKVVYGQTITNLVWNAKLGYWTIGNTTTAAAAVYVSPNGAQNNYAHELLAKDFGLKLEDSYDKWGRPAHKWTKGTATIGQYLEAADATYYTAVTECTIANDVAQSEKEKTYTVYVNGSNVSKYVVQQLDTVNTIGAQGRATYVYDDRIVMIDTFLAKVEGVKDVAYDAAGHVKSYATITLTAYDVAGGSKVTLTSDSNYTYAKGDYVLLNAYTATGNEKTSGVISTSGVNKDAQYGEIVGKAESFEGAQSVIWYNTKKHTVEGTTYDDAYKFLLDEAGVETAKHTWFKDQYGNLIGAANIDTIYNYGVITKMYWEPATGGAGKVMADVTYVDGTPNTVTVSSVKLTTMGTVYTPVADAYTGSSSANTMAFKAGTAVNGYLYVAQSAAANATADNINDANHNDIIHGHLMQIETLSDGTVALTVVTPEATAATVTNKAGYFTGTVNGAAVTVAVDTNTKFLYRSGTEAAGFTYTPAAGINEVPSFKTGATVDYVLSNGVATYVYIIGETVDSTAKNFVYINSSAYSAQLKTLGGVNYWELTLPVPAEDGSVATLKVLDKDGLTTTVPAIVTALTSDTSIGQLFYVEYTNGYATKVTKVTTTAEAAANNNVVADATGDVLTSAMQSKEPMPFNYNKDGKSKVAKIVGATRSNGVITAVGGTTADRYNVTGTTEVVGTLADDMTDKVLYIIYTETGISKVIDKVYVCDQATTPSTPVLPTLGTVVYQVQFVDIYGTEQGAVNKIATQTNVAPNAYTTTFAQLKTAVAGGNTLTWTNEALANALISGVADANGSTETFTVTAGGTVVVTFKVVK